MNNKAKSYIIDILSGQAIGFIFVSTMFVGELIAYHYAMAALLYFALMIVIHSLGFISDSNRSLLCRWITSIVSAFLFLQYFRRTYFAVRGLNWVFPGYGRASAGGGFAFLVALVCFSGCCLVGIIIVFSMKSEKYGQFRKYQLILILAVEAMIWIAVLILNSKFPAFDSSWFAA